MKQLTQELKGGKMELIDVPCPTINDNEILVKNLYSVISPGTESKTVIDARKGYIAKARDQLNVPNVSLDIAYDGIKFHLLEYQCVYFGTAGIARSNHYFKGKKDNWISYHNDETDESVYAYSIAKYIKHTQA